MYTSSHYNCQNHASHLIFHASSCCQAQIVCRRHDRLDWACAFDKTQRFVTLPMRPGLPILFNLPLPFLMSLFLARLLLATPISYTIARPLSISAGYGESPSPPPTPTRPSLDPPPSNGRALVLALQASEGRDIITQRIARGAGTTKRRAPLTD